MKLGDKIRELRQMRSWSQKDLAAAIQESRQSVEKWEKGETMPELDRLIHLSILFEVPLRELAGESIQEYELSEKQNPRKEAEKKKKDRLLLGLKLLAVGIMILMGILINLVWFRFLYRFY